MSDKKAEAQSKASDRSSRAIRTRDVKLGSVPAQKVFKRHFDVVSDNLFQISVMTPILTSDSVTEQAESIVNGYFEAVENDMEKEIDRQKELMKTYGIEETPEYTNTETVVASITTPQAARFMNIISQLDELILHFEAVWLEGQYTNRQRNAAIYQYQRRVARLGGRIRNLAFSLKKVLEQGKQATAADIVEAGKEAEAKADKETEAAAA